MGIDNLNILLLSGTVDLTWLITQQTHIEKNLRSIRANWPMKKRIVILITLEKLSN